MPLGPGPGFSSHAPRTLLERTLLAGAPPESSTSSRSSLESIEVNTPGAQAATHFDPVALNVRYFDEATGTVYSPDRSLKLFTIEDGSTGGATSPWLRRGGAMGVALLAIASGALAWRKFRGP